jgi:acyl CoA:acetate/3-ketoacid CoA transferase alpha subunit
MRAGGSGIPAFFTITGRRDAGRRRRPAVAVCRGRHRRRRLTAKEVRLRGRRVQREYVLEHAIVADYGLVRAWKGDRHGNLVFNKSSRNFNPLAAMAGRSPSPRSSTSSSRARSTPTTIHLPGIYVQRVVPLTPEQAQTSASSAAPSPSRACDASTKEA